MGKHPPGARDSTPCCGAKSRQGMAIPWREGTDVAMLARPYPPIRGADPLDLLAALPCAPYDRRAAIPKHWHEGIVTQSSGMKSYWDEKITWWASSSYEERPRGPIERWMARLRRSVHARAVIALDLLRPHLHGRTVVDIGCGNGHFAKGCIELGAAHVTGIDISPQAVDLARRLAAENGIADRTTFLVGKAGDGNLPDSDFVTGFGLIDWLGRQDCLALFRAVRGRQFVFSYSEMDRSSDEWIHYFYLVERLRLFGNGVRAYHHPRRVIFNRLHQTGHRNVQLVCRREMRFGRLIHNLDD